MRIALALALALLMALAAACGDDERSDMGQGTPSPATITFTGAAGERAELTVELARTAAERGRGLMFRTELAEERGMLFVFERETKAGFWMKDTLIPLTVAFIASDGLILETQDMAPLSEELHTPAESYLYALEVNQGWFERHGLAVGDRVEIPAEAEGE